MAFNIPAVVPGAPSPLMSQMGNINSLTQQNLNNQILQSQAQYAPYTNYANAVSTLAKAQYLPAQLQAQVLSNPLLWASLQNDPTKAQNLLNNFTGSLPSNNSLGSLPGGGNIPAPTQSSGGVWNALMSKLGLNNNNVPANNTGMGPHGLLGTIGPTDNSDDYGNAPNGVTPRATPEQIDAIYNSRRAAEGIPSNIPVNSVLIPGSRGALAGVISNKTAAFNESPYKGTFYDPTTKQIYSAPTETFTSQAQTSINAQERAKPQIDQLAQMGSQTSSALGTAKYFGEKAANFVNNKFNYSLPSQQEKYNQLLRTAPESLLKAYGLNVTDQSIKNMEEAIKFHFGETPDTYKARLYNFLNDLHNEQAGTTQKNLAGGFQLTGNNAAAQSPAQNNNAPPANAPAPAPQNTRVLNGITYRQINGQWYQ